MRRLALVASALMFCLSALLAQGRGREQAQAALAPNLNLPAGDVKRGESNYAKYGCWECHGYTGQTDTGAKLVSTVLNANGFVNYIRSPRTNQMPLYSAKVVSDQDAADLYAYIKTFKKPPEAKDIPLLQQIISEK